MKPNLSRLLLFAISLCLSVTLSKAQNTSPSSTYLNNFVQPPPNAGSLGKYADFPVGYYTGVPNISIPLYTLKDGSISLPISISYHASGIRVSELPSWVGLGWALNATGVINRTVRGAPDEGTRSGSVYPYAPRGYYEDFGWFGPSLLQFLPYPGSDQGFTDQRGVDAKQNKFYNTVMPAVLAGGADFEPDLYTFNFNGHTGKFVFDEQRNVRLLEDDNLKIKVIWNSATQSFDSWVITAEDGIQYFFGENNSHEIVLPFAHGNYDANSAVPANWYLTRIYNPNTKETVTFNYVPEGYSYYDLGPESTVYGGSASNPVITNACNNTNINNNGASVANFITTSVVGLRLSTIVTSNFTVKFIASTSRLDLNQNINNVCVSCIPAANVWSGVSSAPAYSLDSVKIYSNQNNSCIKQIALTHSYFTSPTTTGQSVATSVGSDITDTKRLKLSSVTEISGDGTISKPPYIFTYQESITLPRRLSYDQDHWGFSNNQAGNNNNYFTPPVKILTLNGPTGANRKAKWPEMSAFTLTNIHDPLGVNTTFTYSQNTAWNGYDLYTGLTDTLIGGLRIQQIAVTDNITGKSTIRKFSYNAINASTPGGILTHVPVYIMVPYNEYFSWYAVHASSNPQSVNGGYAGDYSTYGSALMVFKQSMGIVPMQDADGNHIVYPYVRETFGANGEDGYKLYTFNTLSRGDPTNPQVNSRLDFNTYVSSQFMPNWSMVGGYNGSYTNQQGYYGTGDPNDTVGHPLFTPVNLHYSMNHYECYTGYPSVPSQVDLVGNKLLEEDTYDANGNVVTTMTNQYTTNFHENFWIRGMRGCFPLDDVNIPYKGVAFYKLHTGVSHLTSTTKKTYTGSNYITEVSNYGYESPYHTLKTSDTTTDSQGNVLINKTYYSWDYANTATGDNIFGKMKARHILAPVRTDNWRNGNLIGERVTRYADFATSAPDTLINPVNVYNLETGVPLTPAQASESATWSAPVSTLLPNSYLISKVGFSYDGSTGKMTGQQLTYDKSQGIQWSSQLKLPVALVDNATNTPTLKEFYYEGFEESASNSLYTGNGHTGTKSVFAPYTVNWTLPNSRSYVITYWYYTGGVWKLQPEQAFTGSLALTGGTAYDDIRIFPKDANMITYTYDIIGNLTSTMDQKGLTTYYEYDSFQRLKNIRDKDRNIVKSYCYNYAGQANGCYINQPAFTNATLNSSYFKNDCNSGYTGTAVGYAVSAGAYISNISQQDADDQASADVAANGQRYANINGSCVQLVTITLTNTTNSGYQINFTGPFNITFDFLNNGTKTIQVPVGTYSVDIYPTGAYVNHTIKFTGQTTPPPVPRTVFSPVTVSTSPALTATVQ